MTRDDIIKLAREAGLDPDLWNYTDAFERFAALVAEQEREACAKVCDFEVARLTAIDEPRPALAVGICAAAIRARGESMSNTIEALKLALEALEHEADMGNDNAYQLERDIIREALAEQPAQPYKGIADHTNQATNGRVKIDPVTGNLGIGMPFPRPAHQKPVAYSYTSRITGAQGFSHHPMPRFIDSESWDINPLYPSPPASKPWMGLTDEERNNLWRDVTGWGDPSHDDEDLMKAIEAKLREKNT